MSVDPNQKSRYTNEALSILKSNFADRTEAIFALRKYMLQIELDEVEQKLIDSFDSRLWEVLKMGFLPKIEGNMPINQEVDLWMLAKIDDKTPEEAHYHIMARQLMKDYLEAVLLDGYPTILFKDLSVITSDREQNYINILAKQLIFMHIESQLGQAIVLAGKVDETPEETMERLQKNSSK